MKHLIWLSTILMLASCLPAETRAQTQGFKFTFDKPKMTGNLTLNFFDANRSFEAIKIVVPISKDMTPEQKTFTIFSTFVQQARNDPATMAWRFDIPAGNMTTFTVTNIPKFLGKTLVNVNPSVVARSKEPVDHVDRLAGAPDTRGVIQFASTSFDLNDDGSPALFHAGVDFNGVEYSAEVSASVLGGDTSGQHIAELLYQQLFPQVSSFATIQDPALIASDALVIDLLPSVSPDAEFGVSFGTTSPTGGVVGALQVVPEPATLTLVGLGGVLVLGWRWCARRKEKWSGVGRKSINNNYHRLTK